MNPEEVQESFFLAFHGYFGNLMPVFIYGCLIASSFVAFITYEVYHSNEMAREIAFGGLFSSFFLFLFFG